MTPSWKISASTGTVLVLHEQLRKFFRSRIPRSVDADDLANNTWLAAGRCFQHRCTLRYYLFFIAERVLIDSYRRRDHLVLDGSDFDELPADGRALDSGVLAQEWQARIAAALEQVGDPYDEVVKLWLAGWDNVAIARKLGIKHNTVRSRLSRGKQQLLAALDQDE